MREISWRSGLMCGTVAVLAFIVVCAALTPVARADTFVLAAGSYKALGITLQSGDQWEFSVQSSNAINVLTMDNDNYNIFKNGGTPMVYTDWSTNSVTQKSFTVKNVAGEVWIVMKSTTLIDDTTVDYTSNVIPASCGGNGGGGGGGGNGIPGFDMPIVILAGIIAVSSMALIHARRRR